jgi:TonB family protein
MRISRTAFIAIALLAVGLNLRSANAQQAGEYPPFTLTMQMTSYDAAGHALMTLKSTSYHSSSGDWRSAGVSLGYEMATIYRRSRGVYRSNARTAVTVKVSDHAPGCPRRTAEQLRRDPKFVRTEIVLGFTAYVLSEQLSVGYLMETYFVPELGGGTPFKCIYTFQDGRKIAEDPISVTLAEPAPEDIVGPNYTVIEQTPIFNKKLDSQILSKPDPIYPSEALARGISGPVCVQVTVDESGRVLFAGLSGPIPWLGDAALEAAYQAWFSPTISGGKPVVASGIITYQFVLPRP